MPRFKPFTFTNIIIVITLIMFAIQNSIEYGGLLLGLNMYFIAYGFWWQPLSSMFVHGGFLHIAMNMFVLYQFGNLIEYHLGKKQMFILYFIGGILTSLLSFGYLYLFEQSVNLVGASGAICVLLGFIALFDEYQRKGIVIWVILISVLPVVLGMPVAWYAHFIGFAIGWLFGLLKRA